jgi:anthranilate phosphoribosyltransferase
MITSYLLKPEDLGLSRATAGDIVGGTPRENADDIQYILKGERGPKRDIVVINSAASIYVGRDDLSLREAVTVAEETIDSGKALTRLEQMVEFTNGEGCA